MKLFQEMSDRIKKEAKLKDADLNEYPSILIHYQNLNKKESDDQKPKQQNNLYSQKPRRSNQKTFRLNEVKRNEVNSTHSFRITTDPVTLDVQIFKAP